MSPRRINSDEISVNRTRYLTFSKEQSGNSQFSVYYYLVFYVLLLQQSQKLKTNGKID